MSKAKQELDLERFVQEEFDDSAWGNPSFSKESIIDRNRLEASTKLVNAATANFFLKEIYTEATNLRNMLGDVDGFAADIATSIKSNVLVIATTLKKKPARLVIDALRRLSADDAIKVARATIDELNEFIDTLSKSVEQGESTHEDGPQDQ